MYERKGVARLKFDIYCIKHLIIKNNYNIGENDYEKIDFVLFMFSFHGMF